MISFDYYYYSIIELIKTKHVDTFYLRQCFNVSNGLEMYNNCFHVAYKLSLEEYTLLKEVLGC